MGTCSLCECVSDNITQVGKDNYCPKCHEEYAPKPVISYDPVIWTPSSDEERKEIERLAHGRNDPKIKLSQLGKMTNRRVDEKADDYEMNLFGLKVEFAVAWYTGGNVDKTIHVFGDFGTDISHQLGNIQAKGNTYDYGDLYFDSLSMIHAPFIFLGVPMSTYSGWNIRIVGWITRDEFELKHVPKDFGYGPRVAVTQDKLRPPQTFNSGKI